MKKTQLAFLLLLTCFAAGCSMPENISKNVPPAIQDRPIPSPPSEQILQKPSSSPEKNIPLMDVDNEGTSSINNNELSQRVSELKQEDLSDAEKEGLLFMREEEKLAHDIYVALYEKWGQKSFNNISKSEQTHTDAVRVLLSRYGLQDPNTSTAAGEFKNEELQNLYNQLIEQGMKSPEDAFKVGVTVEEVDIVDLQKYLKDVDNKDITLVYENLLRGSRNHLRAFTRNLKRQNIFFTAGYLPQEEYDSIVNSETEKGEGHGRGNGRKGQGKNE